jgi:hypothetical protein
VKGDYMKLFKSVDEKLAEIGLVKVKENEYGASYERETRFGYTQCVDLVCKASGRHLIQSYEKGVNQDGFNNCVGLSMYEARLCRKKMKRMGWKEKKCQ